MYLQGYGGPCKHVRASAYTTAGDVDLAAAHVTYLLRKL